MSKIKPLNKKWLTFLEEDKVSYKLSSEMKKKLIDFLINNEDVSLKLRVKPQDNKGEKDNVLYLYATSNSSTKTKNTSVDGDDDLEFSPCPFNC